MFDAISDLTATLKHRPMFFLGMIVGAVIFVVFVVEGVHLRERVIRVEADTPCLNLTTRECAKKLLASLTSAERREIERRFQMDVQREAAGRLREVRRQENLRRRRAAERNARKQRDVGGRSPGRSLGLPRRPEVQRPGSSPGVPPMPSFPELPPLIPPTPEPPTTPEPPEAPDVPSAPPVKTPSAVTTPEIVTPPVVVGPVPPVDPPDVPPTTIPIPCIVSDPVVECESKE